MGQESRDDVTGYNALVFKIFRNGGHHVTKLFKAHFTLIAVLPEANNCQLIVRGTQTVFCVIKTALWKKLCFEDALGR